MTTTGGPEHSVTEPVTQEHFDGDDIVVLPDAAPTHRHRSRALVIGAVVVLLAAGVGIAIAVTRDDGKKSAVRTVTPRHPAPAPASPPPRTPPKQPVARKPPASIAPHTPVSSPPAVAVAPPPPVAPTNPPVTAPPSYPPSELQWTATPAALTIKSGGHGVLTVHVTNPTNGTVTLPNPLSCAPVLRGPKGHVFGFGVCEEMAQVMSAHDALTQHYTIYATDTGAAGGNALTPGNYTVRVENLFTVKVMVKTGGP